jgi:serine protease DegQ
MRARCMSMLSRVVVGMAFIVAAAGPSSAEAPSLDRSRGIITFAPILEKAMPAVVSIAVKGRTPVERSPLYHHPLFERFGLQKKGPAQTREFVSSASGVIVDAGRCLIMTNVHSLVKADGREFDATLVGSDPPTDVALLRIAATGLTELAFADSDRVRIGDIVLAVGSPFGLRGTATMGIVGAMLRSGVGYETYESFIQIDAAVNSGNSGGPLVDQHGGLIGINTAILSPMGGNVGIGFAIPSNMARRIMGQLLTHGRVPRGQLGARTKDLSAEIRALERIAEPQGAFISSVQAGSPAAEAGLARGDVIVGLQGEPIRSAAELKTRIAAVDIGQVVSTEFVRSGTRHQVQVTIRDIKLASERLVLPPSAPRLAGVVVASIEPGSAIFGEVKGVEVVEVRRVSRAALSGLAVGDIIIKIDGSRVRAPEDVIELTKGKTRKYTIDVVRDGVPIRVVMR